MSQPTVESRLREIEERVRADKPVPWTDVRDLVMAIRDVHHLAMNWEEWRIEAGREATVIQEVRDDAAQEIFQALEARLVPGERRATA